MSTEPYKLVFVTGVDPNKCELGGIQVYVIELIRHLLELSSSLSISLLGISYDKPSTTLPITFIPVLKNEKMSTYRFLYRLLLTTPSLKIPNDAIIHSQRPEEILAFVLFYKHNPKVLTLHGNGYVNMVRKRGIIIGTFYRIIEYIVLKKVDNVIFVVEDAYNFYIKKYPWLKGKTVVIPVGINTEQFKLMDKHQMRRKYGFGSKDKIIMFVGRLEEEKNLEFLLRTFKNVNKNVEDARLVLVGDGRERKNLKNLAEQLELDNITFMGSVLHDNIPEVLSCADVFVLCSLYESGPIVVQEALACGVPCVTTNVGRAKEFIVGDLIGRVVGMDESDFAKAIIDMLTVESEKVREECRKVAMNFDFEKTAKQTIKAYERLSEEWAK